MDRSSMFESLAHDIRYAARSLRASRGFAAAAVSTLGIGIGATVAIFSTVNATLLRPLPFPRPDDLISVRTRLVDGRVTTGLVSPIEIGALLHPGMPVSRHSGSPNTGRPTRSTITFWAIGITAKTPVSRWKP